MWQLIKEGDREQLDLAVKVVHRTGETRGDSGRQSPANEDDSGESNDTWAGISGGGGNEGKSGR